MSIKAWNDEQELELIKMYTENDMKDVYELASHFSKGYRSVISKLVQLKIYEKPEINEEDKSLTVEGTIELGDASDTTIARSAAGIATIEGKQIFTTNTPALTSAAAGVPAVTMQIRRTITTAEANALNSTPIELIPAQGANTVIVLAGGMIRIDRAATQTNSAADMNLHYEGLEPGTFAQTTLFHARRFMYNETGDRVFNIIPGMSAYEVAQSLTQDVNKAVEVSVDSALTSNCITSMEFYLTYNVFNIS